MMNDNRIDEIVRRVFDKAKKECASHTNYALSNHVGVKIDLSSKTLERAYNKYINRTGKDGSPTADSVDLLCTYLGFENYEDFVEKNSVAHNVTGSKKLNEPPETVGNGKWLIIGSIVIGVIVLTAIILKDGTPEAQEANFQKPNKCMTWVNTHFEETPCFTSFNTKIVPLDQVRLETLKKVKVNMATQFFSEETNKPIIWYHKTKEGEIEYFTAPSLHPVNGATLLKITPYIIETYVPVHIDNKSSFVN